MNLQIAVRFSVPPSEKSSALVNTQRYMLMSNRFPPLLYHSVTEGPQGEGDTHHPVHWCAYKDAAKDPAALAAMLDWLRRNEPNFNMEVKTGAEQGDAHCTSSYIH